MEVTWAQLLAGYAAITAPGFYFVRKYFDYRLERLKTIHNRRFDIGYRIEALMREVSHQVDHLRDGHVERRELCRENSLLIRKFVRENIGTVGDELDRQIHAATNIAMAYANIPNETQYDDWTEAYARARELARILMRGF